MFSCTGVVLKIRDQYTEPARRKTHVGRLLAGKEYRDDKSYRNLMDMLLKEAETYTIIKRDQPVAFPSFLDFPVIFPSDSSSGIV